MGIFAGIITALLSSISYIFRKKAMTFYVGDSMTFKMFPFITSFVIAILLVLVFGLSQGLFSSSIFLVGVGVAAVFGVFNDLLEIHVTRNEKLSNLLPYGNVDKIFIIIFGFFFASFLGETASYITLGISLILVICSTLFSLHSQKLSGKIGFSKNILLFILYKCNKAASTIFIAYLLVDFSTVDYFSANVLFSFLIISSLLLFSGKGFSALFNQRKELYKFRMGASVIGEIGFVGGLFIIENVGVVIATLIGFLGIVFNIIFMKLILKDSPSKQQMMFAFFVVIMIGIGYYFK